ncbi:MAG: aspartate-semialdehyde dehydrogenase [Gammaproteobacteria bacterium]|nr:aspartate-semialdehyde dehydrogenase [Gammaproteobacteria bacterium]
MEKVNVAIAGATGAVGESLRLILEQRQFPIDNLSLLASPRSVGRKFEVNGRSITVENLAEFDFSDTQIGLFSAGGSISAIHAPRAAEAGTYVIDNTSHFRYEPHIPLVVPEVNPHQVRTGLSSKIIANPNCSTIQMVVALNQIQKEVGIERINVATYQAVSGAGASAMRELEQQTKDYFDGKEIKTEVAPVQIAFNAIPQINSFDENGYTTEEMKMVWETKKIFEDDSIMVNPTCVRIPVFVGHSEAVHIETKTELTTERARELIAQQDGVELIDEHQPGGYPTAALHGAHSDQVFVGRVRKDISHPRGLNMWVVSDNVRKGAALNSIQIAEHLLTMI